MANGGLTPLMRDVRDRNLAALLRHVVACGPTGRKQLGRATGLSFTTVTRLAGNLVAAGILAELPPPARTGQAGRAAGRPEIPLGFADRGRFVVGAHIHARRVTATVFDLAGAEAGSFEVNCTSAQPETVVAAAVAATGLALGSVPAGQVLGIGLATGGTVDAETGRVVDSPQLGWRDVDLGTPFARFGVPVLIDNSVRCFALAPLWDAAAPAADSTLTVFVANVVGAALVVNRTLHRGPGASAGEIAHLPVPDGPGTPCPCGRTDCLGVVATNRALHARAVEAGLLAADTPWAEVLRDDLDGVPGEGLRMLRQERARVLGEAVGFLQEFYNPELTVVAGYLGTPGDVDLCLAAVRARTARTSAGTRCRVEHRDAVGTSWDRASAALVLDDFLRRPTAYEAALLD
ncbi:ROK family protein [Kitasatospora cineracea]|uniref:Putative NBD/HSP70 family sugar kinase n=1 Tax=Kitasatospora cineracea TaxID=88074 RepID=A0A8G1ULR4_9ACTN|nr:ROK family protein [Kitasatospora cineracea]ROR46390.1 putative NBD/HSP70 family sugar kinase [Kitasatospora cineracea]